jgi:hypothetical protein
LSNPDQHQKNEHPGALAGASGAKRDEIGVSDASYRLRIEWANTLRFVIRECHPVDAALILSEELQRLSGGAPLPPLLKALEEAQRWAEFATPVEHKAYAMACYEAMPGKTQAGFRAYLASRAGQ